MRLLKLLTPALVLGLAGVLRAADVQFVRVWPSWQAADSFKRISEYFNDTENDGGWIVVRTKPASRPGYYFLARVEHTSVPLDGAHFALQVILPTDPAPKAYSFPVSCPAGSHVFDLGLTGTDWPGKGVHPVAWRLDLVASDGRVLASKQSFLWAKPAK
jgi:hypothetical protein